MAIILESFDEFQSSPMTDRERELLHTLRTMLKDLDHDVYRSLNTLVEEQRGERWSDAQLLIYINQAISDINAEPPHTSYDLSNFPEAYKSCVINGAMIFALIAESIIQTGENFSYSDNGISLSINQSTGYQGLAQMLLSGYTQLKKDIKRAMRPSAAGLKSSPAPVRVRSYSPRQRVYR